MEFTGFRKIAFEIRGVDLYLSQVATIASEQGQYRVKLIESIVQLDDGPIFVALFATSLGFPPVAHVFAWFWFSWRHKMGQDLTHPCQARSSLIQLQSVDQRSRRRDLLRKHAPDQRTA